jgi:hypothetical protein
MVDKSVFPSGHEPDSTKRRGAEGESLYSNHGTGRHRGKALTPEQRRMEEQAKGHREAGGPGREGEVEIADPHSERGIQHGYGKNQDKEEGREGKKTAQNKAMGAQEGRYRPQQSPPNAGAM